MRYTLLAILRLISQCLLSVSLSLTLYAEPSQPAHEVADEPPTLIKEDLVLPLGVRVKTPCTEVSGFLY